MPSRVITIDHQVLHVAMGSSQAHRIVRHKQQANKDNNHVCTYLPCQMRIYVMVSLASQPVAVEP